MLEKPNELKLYMVVMQRGTQAAWKMIVAYKPTGPSMQTFVSEAISTTRRIRQKVRGSTTAKGARNKA